MASILSSCASQNPSKMPAALPQHWQHKLEAGPQFSQPDLKHWWMIFGDAQLNQLVDEALKFNLDVLQARERIQRSRDLLGHAGDEFLPELHFRTHTVENIEALDTYFQFGLDASWELGLFGRREATQKIAQAKANNILAGGQEIQVSIIGELVRAYIELRTAQAHIALLDEQALSIQHKIDLLKVRKKLKLGNSTQEFLAEQELSQNASALMQRHQFVDMSAQRLALLLGKATPDSEWLIIKNQPQFDSIKLTTLPADIIRTRPDIQAAEAAVVHASGELGIAESELYPHISLGSAFLYAINITRNDEFSEAVHSTPGLGPTLDIPLFDWGRRRALVKAENHAFTESLYAYKKTLLEAMHETETAISTLQLQHKLLENTKNNLTLQTQITEKEQKKYQFGLGNKIDFYDALHTQTQFKLDWIDAHAAHDLALVALFKALGGAPLILETQLPAGLNSNDFPRS